MYSPSFVIFQTDFCTTNLPTASQREGFGGHWTAKGSVNLPGASTWQVAVKAAKAAKAAKQLRW